MSFFPFFIDLLHRSCLIAGGGPVALRKAESLLPFGPSIIVVAPELCSGFDALPSVTVHRRRFSPQDLDGIDFAIAATDDRDLNRQISALCRSQRIPVNSVDDPESCTYYFPALVRRGELTVGITTGGASPAAAAWVREEIDSHLPSSLEAILPWMELLRPQIKSMIPDSARRSALFTRLLAAALEQGGPLSAERTNQLIQEVEQR